MMKFAGALSHVIPISALVGGMALACGGGGHKTPPPPTPTIIQGTCISNYHTLSAGDVPQPVDLSNPAEYPSGSIAALIPDGLGGYTTVVGGGKADGTFSINATPTGYYWLKFGSLYLWTHKVSLDLGQDLGGRRDAQLPSKSTDVVFNVSNLNPWNSSADNLLFYNYNANDYIYGLEGYARGNAPTDGATALAGLTIDWFSPNPSHLNDGAKGDHPYLVQMVGTSDANWLYQVAQRVFEPASYTQVDAQSTTLNGSFVALPQTGTLRLNVKASEFTPNAAIMGPSAELSDQAFYLTAAKGIISAGYSGDLADFFPYIPFTNDFDLGEISYGNPYPSAWDKVLEASCAYLNSYTLPGTTAPWNLDATISVNTTTLPTATAPLRPLVTPVLNPKINDLGLLADRSGVGLTPTLSWEVPSLGSPSGYIVTIYRLDAVGNSTEGTVVADLRRPATSGSTPPGILVAGNTYVFRIRVIQQGLDMLSAPYRCTLPYGYADVVSGLITP